MKQLEVHPLFAGCSRLSIQRLTKLAQIKQYAAGDVILRNGEFSTELHGVLTGAVRVELPGKGGRVVLAPPQSFGEMSALSGSAVSATVIALRDTKTWVLAGAELFSTLAEEPAFFRNVSHLLGERLRHRSRESAYITRPSITIVVAETADRQALQILEGLHAGVRHYEPASVFLDARTTESSAILERLGQWRNEGSGGQILLVLIRADQTHTLCPLLEPLDVVLWVAGSGSESKAIGADEVGAADRIMVRLGTRATLARSKRWTHVLEAAAFMIAAQGAGRWEREKWPQLDRLVRQICRREIGLALSVGAAAGLAHLGLLETLEAESVPFDFLCGSSMGGAVSLAYAYFGNARSATDTVCGLAGDFARRKGLRWLPRGGLVSAARMEAISSELFGCAEFSELDMPVAVVAADLVASRRVVLDTGSLALAARATAAIPGLFPPVRLGDAILVDGGLVTRVPADLLAIRRGGLRLAALIEPEKSANTPAGKTIADALTARLERPLGLRTALAASWSLLGWWDSAAQAQLADVVVRIPTPSSDGFNFHAAQSLVDHGRRAARAHLPAIRAAVQRVLSPGAP